MPRKNTANRTGHWLGKVGGSDNWYLYWWDTEAGCSRRKSLGTSDEAEAQVALAETILKTAKPTRNDDPDNYQLAVGMKLYLMEHGDHVRSASSIQYEAGLALDFFGTATYGDLTPIRMTEFANHLRRRDRPLAESTICRTISTIIASANHARKNRRLTHVPYIQNVKGKSKKSTPIFTTLPQLKEFLDRCKVVPHLYRYVMMGINTLGRPEAVTEITQSQLNFEASFINLNPEGREQNKKYRAIIPMTKTIHTLLKKWIAEDTVDFPVDGKNRTAPPPIVHYRGEPIESCRHAFERVGADMGIKVTRRSLRNTMATLITEAAVTEGNVARALGHKPPDTGSETARYIHFQPHFMQSVADAIDRLFEKLETTPDTVQAALEASKGNNIVPMKRPA